MSEPVAWRVYCTVSGATGYLYTEKLPFEPGPGVRVRREPEPLYAGVAQGVQEIDAWMRADGSAATVNPMTAGMWKAQGHTIEPLYRHPASQVPSTNQGCEPAPGYRMGLTYGDGYKAGCSHAAIISLDGKWHCQKCGDAIEMAEAQTSTHQSGAPGDIADRWPIGCHSPASCSRNGKCMYIKCRHDGKDIKALASAFSSTNQGGGK